MRWLLWLPQANAAALCSQSGTTFTELIALAPKADLVASDALYVLAVTMGCGSSKAVGTIIVKPQGPHDAPNKAPNKRVVLTTGEVSPEVKRSASQSSLSSTKSGRLSRSMQSLKARKEREKQDQKPEASDSLSSLDSRLSSDPGTNERASAKSSRTVDSGLGDDYTHVITEHSNLERKQSVENQKLPPTPGLPLCVSVARVARG